MTKDVHIRDIAKEVHEGKTVRVKTSEGIYTIQQIVHVVDDREYRVRLRERDDIIYVRETAHVHKVI